MFIRVIRFRDCYFREMFFWGLFFVVKFFWSLFFFRRVFEFLVKGRVGFVLFGVREVILCFRS